MIIYLQDMNWNTLDFFPVMGEKLNLGNTVKLDFSPSNPDLESLDLSNTAAFDEYAHVGPFPENGDWPPHLHFQLMWDLMGNFGDFPGVCSKRDMDTYQANCPDPNLILRSEVL